MLLRCLALGLLTIRFCCATLNLPSSQPVFGFGLTNAFPGISFDHPVVIASPPGETNRLFIGEKHGRIMVINDLSHPTASVFLDLTQSTWFSEESGLLGLAFHPKYQENGRFFVFKISLPDARDELLEFKCDPPSTLTADPNSQITLISQLDASDTHNAGDLKFGPDGYLYLSLGDETPPLADAHDSPQAIDKGFFSGILRIDVDLKPENLPPNPHPSIKGPYRVPRDNPFIGATSFNGAPVDPAKVRTEFFAVGMRNPWRFNFDPFTGQLICGDVGAGAIEEIDIVQKGGNYGWPYMEGSSVSLQDDLPAGLQLPVYEYPHGTGLYTGRVIIGGLVYAGDELPGLRGKYLFADYDSGNLWALDLSAADKKPIWLTSRTGTAAFGLHPADGGVLVANHMEGRIERLAYRDPASGAVPLVLSGVNAFANLNSLLPATNLFGYQVITPLWSDGAIKQRWIDFSKAIGKLGFNENDPWDFPEGTVFVKHFELELTNGVPESRRRVETRVLVKTSEDIYGMTYRWGDSLRDAYLVPPSGTNDTFVVQDGGILRTQVWHYPTWDQCRTCHSREAGLVLGFRTDQLNRTTQIDGYPTNQLAWLAAQGLFAGSAEIKPERLRRLAGLDDPVAPMQYRVRSYLESNCVQCHQPGARSAAVWDARIATPFAQAHILDSPAVFYTPPMKIIATHDPENSYLYLRAKTRSPLFGMPPLATSIVDEQFVNLVNSWIMQIPDASWHSADIGPALVDGSAEFDGQALRISSAGGGVATNSFFFSGRTAVGASEFSAKLTSLAGDSPSAEAGLMLRANLASDAPTATLLRQEGSLVFLVKAAAALEYQTVFTTSANEGSRLKLLADGQNVCAWIADDALNWRLLASVELDLGFNYFAGFAVASGGEAAQFATAQFNDIRLDPIGLSSADSDGDGFSDALESSLGYDPHSPLQKPAFTYGFSEGAFEVKLTRRAEPSDLTLLVELSTDLLNWSPAADPAVIRYVETDENLTWKLPTGAQQQFIRFSVVNRPVPLP
jgi:glucose/arabinose dehydrogenase